MDSTLTEKYKRYLVYPNESIDKLTVNRTFERIFDEIETKSKTASLNVSSATETSYGTARFSVSGEYSFDGPVGENDTEYSTSMLTIPQMKNLSERLSDGTSDFFFVAPTSEGETIEDNLFWARAQYMDSKFTFMPNGVNVLTCSFNLGFNGLSPALGGHDIARSDIISPISLSGYDTSIDIDDESRWNIMDFINDNSMEVGESDITVVRKLYNLDGCNANMPFMESLGVTLRHNRCSSTEDSAYNQSYVEICMSTKISVKSLFTLKYGRNVYETIDSESNVVDMEGRNDSEIGRKPRLFTQKPIVMAQIGFFNNDSKPPLLFGLEDMTGEKQPIFASNYRLSQKPVDEIMVDGNAVSPVDGCVIMKGVENLYDASGNIVDNLVYLDIVMKFMAGSATDPEMEYALNTLNSCSRIQVAMIGV